MRFLALSLTAVVLPAVQAHSQAPAFKYSEELAKAFVTLTQATFCSDAADRQRLLQWECPECAAAGFRIDPSTTRFVQAGELGQRNSTLIILSRMQSLPGAAPPLDAGESCVIVIRGSVTVTNYLEDVAAWQTPLKLNGCIGCMVEDGFYSVLKGVIDSLVAGLHDIGCTPEDTPASTPNAKAVRSLHLTGHSLGGAVSTLAMPILQEMGFAVKSAHFFESPRVGNANFASFFKQEFTTKIPVWRVTYSQDPVPHLPPTALSYTHVDHEVHYDVHGKYVVCNETEDSRGANQFPFLDTIVHGADHTINPLATHGKINLCPWVTPEVSSLAPQSDTDLKVLV